LAAGEAIPPLDVRRGEGDFGGFFVLPPRTGESILSDLREGEGVITSTRTASSSSSSTWNFFSSERFAAGFGVRPGERFSVPFAGDARTRDNRVMLFGDLLALEADPGGFEGFETEPNAGVFESACAFSSEALAAAVIASALNLPVDMGVRGSARATRSSAWPGLKKGTGPVSHDPSGVLYVPAPSNVGVIMPPGHSLFAAHVKGVGTPGAQPRLVPTHAGVAANCGVWTVGGGNARFASRVSTGVP
jgi:hypothetical protein